MAFWQQATDQAGREFGARYWRWFAGARVARKLAPLISLVVIGSVLFLGYRLVSPDWSAIGGSAKGWAPVAGRWALVVAAGLLVVALVIRAVVALWQAYAWRWTLHRPMWMRRY